MSKKMIKDDLGNRQKSYEKITKIVFRPKSYIVSREDGSCFHSHVHTLANLQKPFDPRIIEAIDAVMLVRCQKTSNAIFAYCQSDEINTYFSDKTREETQPTEGGVMNKIISKGASRATWRFNQVRELQDISALREILADKCSDLLERGIGLAGSDFSDMIIDTVIDKVIFAPKAEFDSRAFALNHNFLRRTKYWKDKCKEIPELKQERLDWLEMHNNIYWRFKDCVRNSVSGLAQFHFSQSELQNKNQLQMLQMLREKGYSWEALPDEHKYGRMCVREDLGDRREWKVKPMMNILDRDIRKQFYELLPNSI